MDGELFILHDSTLHRTTNIEKVYPDRVDQHFSYFNTTEIDELSAGDWFLKVQCNLSWQHTIMMTILATILFS